MDSMLIAKRIKELCELHGWSQYRLGVEAKIPQATLYSIMKGTRMLTIPTIIKICNTLGITLSEFFAGIEDASNVRDRTTENEIKSRLYLLNDNQQQSILFYILGLTQQELPTTYNKEET